MAWRSALEMELWSNSVALVKGNITDRQPDAVYQSTFYGVVEPVKVDLSTQIVAPWQIHHVTSQRAEITLRGTGSP